MEKTRAEYLSETERLRFDALANHSSIKEAASSMGLTPSTLYNWKSNVKARYRKERGHINAILAQTRRGGCLRNLIHERKKMRPPEEMLDDLTEPGEVITHVTMPRSTEAAIQDENVEPPKVSHKDRRRFF